MAGITIKLGVEDVMSLLGDDPEANLEVRSNVVQQFTSRYLKDLVTTEAMQKTRSVLLKAIGVMVAKEIGTVNFQTVKINPDLRESIRQMISSGISREVSQLIKDAVASHVTSIEDDVRVAVKNVYNANINQLVREKIQKMAETS